MTDLSACIQTAIDGKDVDPDLGRAAIAQYRDLVRRYADTGVDGSSARRLAADDVMESITAQAQKRRHTTLAQIRTMAALHRRFDGIAVTDPDALPRAIEHIESDRQSLEQRFMARISGFLEHNRTRVTGQLRDKAQVLDVARELHGQPTGNASAAEMARAIESVQETARRMFNMLGGDIGKLENRGVRHSHNARAIQHAGFDTWFAELWNNRLIDWNRITDFSTGKPFVSEPRAIPNRAAAERFLGEVYEGITKGGWNKREASMSAGGRALYTRRAEHRVLHFSDADAWLRYNDAFGTSNPFDAIIGELRGMARDIAMMRAFGPNPNLGLEYAAQVLEKQVAGAAGEQRAWNLFGTRPVHEVLDRKNAKARVMMRIVSGAANMPADGTPAAFFAGVRNVLTGAQLGSAILSSSTDLVTMRMAARAMGLGATGPYQRALKLMTDRITQQEAADLGFVFDTWFNTGAAQARMIGDVWSPEWTNRLTNFTIRSTGLSAWTDRARTALRMTFSVELGEQAGRSWEQLDAPLRDFMANRQITAEDWEVLRAPDALYRMPSGGIAIAPAWFAEHSGLPMHAAEDIAARLARAVEDFTELGVPSASLRGRAMIVGDAAPGSLGGELLRSTVMYKSFGLSVVFSHARRLMEMPSTGRRAAYAAAVIAQLTAFGAIGIQLKEIAKGRDPRPMDTAPFWGAAFLQGGGIGIFGDLLTAETTRAGGGLAETVAGPVVGLGGDLLRAAASNAVRAFSGQDTLLGRDVTNLLRRNNPLASHVIARTALDRMVWDQLQALLDPEAQQNWGMANRRAAQSGTSYFWQRGRMAPQRAPNFNNMTGADQ